MKIALAQVTQSIGNIEKNTSKILNFAKEAKANGADLVVFPEFALTGGFCNDLFLNKDFLDGNSKAMEIITANTEINIIAGVVTKDKLGKSYVNAIALFHDSKLMSIVASKELLNDACFNDKKYFNVPGFMNIFKLNNKNFACAIADSKDSI